MQNGDGVSTSFQTMVARRARDHAPTPSTERTTPAQLDVTPVIGRRCWLVLGTISISLSLSYAVTQGYSRFVNDAPELKRMFDMDQEANLPTWWNTVLLGAIAGTLLVASVLVPEQGRPGKRSLAVATLGFTYLSVDEAAQLHELTHRPAEELLGYFDIGSLTYAWLLFGVVAAAAGGAVAWRWGRSLPAGVQRLAALALGLYLAGALVVEAANGWLYARKEEVEAVQYPYLAGTVVEETFEMLACIMALVAFSRLLTLEHRDGRRVVRSAI